MSGLSEEQGVESSGNGAHSPRKTIELAY